MQSAIPGLPPELCDLTIDFLQDDHRALKACSLASRSWLPRTRLYLFHSAVIATEQRYLEFESILEASPEIASCVRKLMFRLPTIFSSKDHWLHHELFRILKTLDKVEELAISAWRAPELSEDMKQDLSTVFPNITVLHFSVVEPPLKDDLLWILRACPKLHVLEFQGCQRQHAWPERPSRDTLLSETPSTLVPETAMIEINDLQCSMGGFRALHRGMFVSRPIHAGPSETLYRPWLSIYRIHRTSCFICTTSHSRCRSVAQGTDHCSLAPS
ncbi:hypothetical protein B0H21DRAFT_207870 [Amylocystis lapponica]|nr:hypothetical protein B0H21DRAFT_207870 [Amylocystis lapponica]